MEFKITVSKRIAQTTSTESLICGNDGDTLTVTFDDEWTNISAKTARLVWIKGGEYTYIDVPFTGTSCPLPAVIQAKMLFVGFFAGDSTENTLKTSTPAQIPCISSILDISAEAFTPDVYRNILDIIANKVDKVEGKGLSTNDYTNEDKDKLSTITKKAGIYSVTYVSSENSFNKTTITSGKALSPNGVIVDYAAGVLSDKIPVRGAHCIISANQSLSGTTHARIAGYTVAEDGTETFVTGTYSTSAPSVAYTTALGETRYRNNFGADFSSCDFIRVSTLSADLSLDFMVSFTDGMVTAYDGDYDIYAAEKSVYLDDEVKVKQAEYAVEVATEARADHLSIHKTMSKFILADKTLKIKLLGDSLTEGYGGTGFEQSSVIGTETNLTGVCWANMLRSYMTSKFDCSFINLGSTSMNSQKMYNNIFLSPVLIDGTEDVVILMIGTNDRKTNTQQDFYNNLKAIVEKIKLNGTAVVLMSSIPSTLAEENLSTNAYHMCDVDNIIMKLASDMNVAYISLYKKMYEYLDMTGGELSTYLNTDGLHPNDEGYKLMFKFILSGLGFGKITE